MRRMIGVIVMLTALGALVSACGGGGSKTVSVPDGGKVSSSNKVPDAFPDNLPIPSGADVQGSYSGRQGDVTGTVVTWTSNDSIDDVKAFFTKQLDGDPWKVDTSGEAGGAAFFHATSKDGKQAAYIYITVADNKTTFIIAAGDSDASGGGDTSTPSDGSGDTSTPVDSGTGGGTLPVAVDLSDDFPKDQVPLPDGARVTNSSSFSSGGGKTFLVEMYVKDEPKDVATFFKTQLEGKGWTEVVTSNANGQIFASYTRTADGGTTNGSVNLAVNASDVSGYAQVSLTLALEGS